MTAILPKTASPAPGRFRWSRGLYDQAVNMGVFEGLHIELIDGEIVQMSPINRPHVLAVLRLENLLRHAFGAGHYVQTQAPLAIGDSEPEPDIAVVSGRPEDYRDHPSTAALVVEVADTSLAFDLGDKVSLYASAGVAEYWVLDLNNRRLVVHRNPRPAPSDPQARFGHIYTQSQTYTAEEVVSPVGAQGAAIKVDDVLP